MAALIDRIRLSGERKALRIDSSLLDLADWSDGWWRTSPTTDEIVENDFIAYVDKLYKGNGIVHACIGARLLPFSEARFQFQELRDGRPGRLFGSPDLQLLETPWANATTGDLLARMEQDGSLAGNAYVTRTGPESARRLRRLRPDWVKILSGVRGDPDASPLEIEAEILGYIYDPPAAGSGRRSDPVFLSPVQVAHYAPIPDPAAQWRGMSWLTPILREL